MIARLGGYVPTFDDASGEPHWRCLRCRVTGPLAPVDESRHLMVGNEVLAHLCLDCAVTARELVLMSLPRVPASWGGIVWPRADRKAVRYWLGAARDSKDLFLRAMECLRAGALATDVAELAHRRLFGEGGAQPLENRP